MTARLIHSSLLSAMETCINQALSLDTAALKKLELLSGKVLRVHCELPDLIINIMISDNKLILSGTEEIEPDTVISGRASALMKLLINKNSASLRENGIVISGNVGLLTELQEILQNLDLDWEYQLSKVIGDIPVQAMSDTLSMAGNFFRNSRDNLIQDLDDYLHEEKKLFPAHSELQKFYQSVDDIRLRVDRLDSRVKRISLSTTSD